METAQIHHMELHMMCLVELYAIENGYPTNLTRLLINGYCEPQCEDFIAFKKRLDRIISSYGPIFQLIIRHLEDV